MFATRNRWWIAVAAVSLIALGCEVLPENGDDAGTGGEGGEDANNGQAGADGAGGVDGGVVAPCVELDGAACAARADCAPGPDGCMGAACNALDEAQCAAREDCAVRRDVFGAFAACRELGDVPCADLEADRCAAREDCAWDGEVCGPPRVTCADHADEAACGAGNCHWWADACHDGQNPNRCDQPDEGTCEAAGCAWTPVGCREPDPQRPCAELREAACSADARCRWGADGCEDDPANMGCPELDLETCVMRNECLWVSDPGGERCVDRPAGDCARIQEAATCEVRPDCRAVYEPVDGCECDGDEAMPCEEGDPNCGGAEPPPPPCDCEPAFLRCERREADCYATPVADCERTPGCRIEVQEPQDCGGMCDCRDGDADCICADDCEPVAACVPDDPAGCRDLQPQQCAQNPDCQLLQREICDGGADGGGAGAPEPPDGDRAPIIEDPPACRVESVCEPRGGPPAGRCEDIADERGCFARGGCDWVPAPGCDCMNDPVPEPMPCDCDPDDANCGCAGLVAPPCDEACFQCVTVDNPPPDDCFDVPPEQCEDMGCMLIEQEVCGCDDEMPPAPGEPIEACVCELWLQCVPPDGPPPPPPMMCEGLEMDACMNDPACEWIDEGNDGILPCECPVDPNGEEVPCACPGPMPGGFCAWAGEGPRCDDLAGDECEAQADCMLDGDRCMQVGEHCDRLDEAACAADRRCRPERFQACEGGGAIPDCPPGEPCAMPPPPPPDCQDVFFCAAALNVCDGLDAVACAADDACVALTADDGTYLGCWVGGDCESLDAGRCAAHPACMLHEEQGGECGCDIGPDGEQICWCEGGGVAWCGPI